MANFEQAVNDAIIAQEIPGCVLVATNRDGSFKYSKAFGSTSMREGKAKPLQLDTTMWIASCTKLMTSLCAMQLVERGLVTLDEPVYKHIPELESFTVIKSFTEDGTPIELKQSTPITLRLLLTHASGLAYDGIHPKTLAWLQYKQKGIGSSGKLLERFTTPLVFQPGEKWMYGPSIDFAGLLIERVTGQSLEKYMQENLWKPLSIRDITFFPSSRPEIQARLAEMSLRDDSGKVKYTKPSVYLNGEGKEIEDCLGGQGTFTSPEEYLKVIHALLTCDEDEKILKKATIEEFFKPQLGEGSAEALNYFIEADMANNAMGAPPKDIKKDWGLGGVLMMSDAPNGGARAGTMRWGGLPNLYWWVDRKTGLCGMYAGQVLPAGDGKTAELHGKFEAAMYEKYAAHIQRGDTSRL